jgi:hypothetical protein
MAKMTKTFAVDSDIIEAIKPLAKKYGVNLSEIVNTALFEVLQSLREVETLVSSNSDGLPPDVARTYLKQKIANIASDQSSVVEEFYPTPKKVKAKA